MMSGSEPALNIMPEARIHRALRRMAMQIVEDSRDHTHQAVLIGLNSRGFALASIIGRNLSDITGHSFTCLPFAATSKQPVLPGELLEALQSAAHVIMVDDVLFSGTTMMRAIRQILLECTPDSLRLAVLVDRGHRTYPIQPDFVGLVSPTKLREHVAVHFNELQQPVGVFLTER